MQEYKSEVGGYLKKYMKINRKLETPSSRASLTHKLICPAMRLMGTGKHMPRAGILGPMFTNKTGQGPELSVDHNRLMRQHGGVCLVKLPGL